MNQLTNQGTTTALSAEVPLKRRRGRPRKDEGQAPLRSPVPSIQGEGSGVPKTTENIPSKGKDSIEYINDDEDYNDEMVGQAVTGVLEYAFDAGYFLTVRVGDSNTLLRGIVFKDDCVVPVTPENDIAPNAKMHKRREFPIPPLSSSPQVEVRTARDPSLNPTENIEIQQQMVPSTNVTRKEDHSIHQKEQSDDKEQQEKSSDGKKVEEKSSDDKELQEKSSDHHKEQPDKSFDDKEHQEKLFDDKKQQEKLSDSKEQQEDLPAGDEIKGEGSAKMESLMDLSEPLMKQQKTDHVTAGQTNEENNVQHNALTAQNSEDAVKSVEAANYSATMESLKDLSEPPMKMQKTDHMTESHSSEEDLVHNHSGLTAPTSEDYVKAVEAADNTVLPEEVVVSPPETALTVKDSSAKQEICRTSGFQISMEDAEDDEDELSESPSEASPMRDV